jgi:hypothetical protein
MRDVLNVSGRVSARPDLGQEVAMKRFDARPILRKLTALRSSMPRTRGKRTPGTMRVANRIDDFDHAALADALESLASELRSAIEEARAGMVDQALEAYYAAEELARDPEHAELVPHVEAMRVAYEREFGRGIPARK